MNAAASVALILVVLAATERARAGVVTSTEDFEDFTAAESRGWTGFRNSIDGSSYGFSESNFTDGPGSGEVGGVISVRSTLSYFADTDLGTTFTLDDAFSASGQLSYSSAGRSDNDAITIGYFDSNPQPQAGRTSNFSYDFLGLALAEGQGAVPNGFRVFVGFLNRHQLESDTKDVELVEGACDFSFQYNPAALSHGQLLAEVGGLTLAHALTAELRGSGIEFDAFGLANRSVIDGDTSAFVRIDDLRYTAFEAPEPASASLIVASLLVLGGPRIRRLYRLTT